MSKFEQIATEYATGHYMGTDFGSRIRVLMRSSEYVLFVGYGLNLVPRSGDGYHSIKQLAEKASSATLLFPSVYDALVKAFGEGAPEAAISAVTKRGMGTILVDGGGEQLPLPHAVAAKLFHEHYASITPTKSGILAVPGKCRQCGNDLTPQTVHHNMGNSPSGDTHPKTIEDCQRLSNYPIHAVHGYSSNSPQEWWPYIDWFEAWDGETYVDDLFCKSYCAEVYGRRAAAELTPLSVGGARPDRRVAREPSVDHYEKVEKWMETADGRRFRF